MHVASQTFAPTMPPQPGGSHTQGELRETFDQFVGETLFGQMLKSMRKSLDKPAYFHGGRGEEIFQSQMDQLLVEEISKASAGSISGPMFELFAGRFTADQAEAGGSVEALQVGEFQSAAIPAGPQIDLTA